MMFDDKVGGWGWLNDDVSKKYTRKKTCSNFFWKNEPELVCSFFFNKNKPCLILALFIKEKINL